MVLCIIKVTFYDEIINNLLIYKGIDPTVSWLNRPKSVLEDLFHRNPRRTEILAILRSRLKINYLIINNFMA